MKTGRAAAWSLVLVLAAVLSAGCAGNGGYPRVRYRSSVVEFLYPKKDVQEIPSLPRLSLPLRVGVAFVPESGEARTSRIAEKEKMDLLDRITAEFRKLPFVKDIDVIPSSYLKPGGGFDNVDQIRTMYGIDVIALVSYDQVQHTDEGLLTLAYWTIVGAYVVKGEKNDTSTMMDAAVFDIASRKMLFRAPGLSHVKGSATPVNLSEQLREDSATGLRLAADDLVVNLKDQLERFKAKVKEKPDEYRVEHRPGYTGGGSLGGAFALALLAGGALALWRGRGGRS